MTFRVGPYRIECTVRYVRHNRKRCPLVRARFVTALVATLALTFCL